MRWAVIQHPEHGGAVVAEDSMSHYEQKGWQRTSDWADSYQVLHPEHHPLPPAEDKQEPATPAKGNTRKGS